MNREQIILGVLFLKACENQDILYKWKNNLSNFQFLKSQFFLFLRGPMSYFFCPDEKVVRFIYPFEINSMFHTLKIFRCRDSCIYWAITVSRTGIVFICMVFIMCVKRLEILWLSLCFSFNLYLPMKTYTGGVKYMSVIQTSPIV